MQIAPGHFMARAGVIEGRQLWPRRVPVPGASGTASDREQGRMRGTLRFTREFT